MTAGANQNHNAPHVHDNTNFVVLTNHPVTPTSFLDTLLGMSDLTGPVAKETWYGHHYPLRRTMVLGVVMFALALVDWARKIDPRSPLWQSDSRNAMRASHAACVEALCDAVQDVELSCVVNGDATQVTLDLDNYQGPSFIPLPRACLRAYEQTLGQDILVGVAMTLNTTTAELQDHIPWINVRLDDLDQRKVPPHVWDALMSMTHQCEFFFPGQTPPSTFPLYQPADVVQPHERLDGVLNKMACVEDMHPYYSDFVIPFFVQVYEWAMENVWTTILIFFFAGSALLCLLGLIGVTVQSIFPVLALHWILPWPHDLVEGKRVTYWSTLRTIVLMETYSMLMHDVWMFPAVCLVWAWHRGMPQATQGWLDCLFVTLTFEAYLCPLLDVLATFVGRFDALNLLGLVYNFLGWIVPGNGWNKLIFAYVILKSHPLGASKVMRRLLRRGGGGDEERDPVVHGSPGTHDSNDASAVGHHLHQD